MNEIIQRAGDLERLGEAYALATVVAVDRPVSARTGDHAIVTVDGRVDGWVGGSCSEPIVVRQALAAIADGDSRLVRIRPPGAPKEPARPGVVTQLTTCASEGGLDVFVEPRLPRPHLVLAGSSPITRTLAKLAKTVGYRVTAAVDDPAENVPGADSVTGLEELARMRLGSKDAVVVATMNRYDEAAVEAALETGAPYIGLVASRVRAENVVQALEGRGVDRGAVDRVRSPAGLDLGPSSQEEIALAILAEVIADRHRGQTDLADQSFCPPDESAGEAVDPVCGMTVAVTPAQISARHGGHTFYFCSPGCRREFSTNPSDYVKAAAER